MNFGSKSNSQTDPPDPTSARSTSKTAKDSSTWVPMPTTSTTRTSSASAKCRKAQLLARHRNESLNSTCTCRNVDFTKWQCRSCFTAKVEKLQRVFRRRVNAPWRGNADTNITNRKHYQRDWKRVRRILQRKHPCLKGNCGRPRLKGLVRNEVLDCRCCGGYVVQELPPLRRSARMAGQDAAVYAEESSRGSSDDSWNDR